jgi:hypothetical protein
MYICSLATIGASLIQNIFRHRNKHMIDIYSLEACRLKARWIIVKSVYTLIRNVAWNSNGDIV